MTAEDFFYSIDVDENMIAYMHAIFRFKVYKYTNSSYSVLTLPPAAQANLLLNTYFHLSTYSITLHIT